MRGYAYSYTVRACRQRWRMPIPLREQFDQAVRRLSTQAVVEACDRAWCVAEVGTVGKIYYTILRETSEMVIAECVLSSAVVAAR